MLSVSKDFVTLWYYTFFTFSIDWSSTATLVILPLPLPLPLPLLLPLPLPLSLVLSNAICELTLQSCSLKLIGPSSGSGLISSSDWGRGLHQFLNHHQSQSQGQKAFLSHAVYSFLMTGVQVPPSIPIHAQNVHALRAIIACTIMWLINRAAVAIISAPRMQRVKEVSS